MSTTPTEILESTAETVEETLAATVAAATEAADALDIESIKGLMDAFDPAALLPEISEIFGTLAVVCRWAVVIGPIVALVLGLLYLFLSPKEANYYFGYRCYFGMGSVYAWRFTQRFAGVLLSVLGAGLLVVMWPISLKFGSMEPMEMVWKAVDCLIWQAVLAFLVNLTIHLTAMIRFDRKGNYRKQVRAEKKERQARRANKQ